MKPLIPAIAALQQQQVLVRSVAHPEAMSTPYGSFRRQPSRPAPASKPAPGAEAHINLTGLGDSWLRYLANSPEPPAKAADFDPLMRSIKAAESKPAPTRQPVPMRIKRRTNTVPLPLALFGGAMALPLLMPVAGGLITIAITGVALVLFGWPLIALIVAPFRRR